jgi:hypothetical protein
MSARQQRSQQKLETAMALQVWMREMERQTLAEVIARLATPAGRN